MNKIEIKINKLLERLTLNRKETIKRINGYVFNYRSDHTFYKLMTSTYEGYKYLNKELVEVDKRIDTVMPLLKKHYTELSRKELLEIVEAYEYAIPIVESVGRILQRDGIIKQA